MVHVKAKITIHFATDHLWWTTIQRNAPAHMRLCHPCQRSWSNIKIRTAEVQPILWLFHTYYMNFARALPAKNNGSMYSWVAVEQNMK